jgi:glucose-1-phosphate adenylyltransferase
VSSADHVFNDDLRPVIASHLASGLTATVVTAEVSRQEAKQNVVVEVDGDGLVRRVEEKPTKPATTTVATELFVYDTARLLETLRALRAELSADATGDDSGIGDFAEHLLPRLVDAEQVRATPIEGYWRDLGRPSAYLQGHRDLLSGKVDIFDHSDRPVLSKWQDRTAARLRAASSVADSLVSPGCDVSGEVVRSVLGPGVVVEKGAQVEDSVLFDDVRVGKDAHVVTAVVDERCVLGRRAVVGRPTGRRLSEEDLVLVGQDSTVGSGVRLDPGARLEPGTTA